jgi:hypothetical protein
VHIKFIASAILTLLSVSSIVIGDCEPNWKPRDGAPVIGTDTNEIDTLIKWDPDGNGPQNELLVAGGFFNKAGGTDANYIACWDGNNWKPLGQGMNYTVYALAVLNGELIAGGNFTKAGGTDANHVARWDGNNWQPMGSGLTYNGSSGEVFALTVYNGQLIAGGYFNKAGGAQCLGIARWTGSNWQQLGGGLSGAVVNYVNALTVYNGRLIAGGLFKKAGNVDVNNIAQWDGSNWQAMNSGMNNEVYTVSVYDGNLIAGGKFNKAGGVDANRIASWDGSGWQTLGAGTDNYVYALTVYDGSLIAGGLFNKAGGVDANKIARWEGNAWQPLGGGITHAYNGNVPKVYALTDYKDELMAGGYFDMVERFTSQNIAGWNGNDWRPFRRGFNNNVSAFAIYDGNLIGSGLFTTADDSVVNCIAQWNGSSWLPVGGGVSGGFYPVTTCVSALMIYNNELIAGGDFNTAGGVDTGCIARWDGSLWQQLGSGMTGTGMLGGWPVVNALTVYNGELIAGGRFVKAGGADANMIARWDGSNWQPLGGGMSEAFIFEGFPEVYALTVYNGELIAGGAFKKAGGVDVNYIARWDGSSWQSLGGGMNNMIEALTVYNGQLIAGGAFTNSGGADANRIARWDGNGWQPLGSGMNSYVFSLGIYNQELTAGGQFTKAGDNDANFIAVWDGNDWYPLSSGMSGSGGVEAITAYKGELVAGGAFTSAGGNAAMYWARWGVPEPIDGDLNHDCHVDLYDLKLLVERWLNDDCIYNGSCYEADLNYDFKVDFTDFARLAENWHIGDKSYLSGDLNGDGKVDMGDLEILGQNWLQDKPELDIAPAGGDGIINFLDFAVIADNWMAGI